jgi:hypothetical protein
MELTTWSISTSTASFITTATATFSTCTSS